MYLFSGLNKKTIAQKMKCYLKNFFRECKQSRGELRIC